MDGTKKTVFVVSIGRGYKEVEFTFEDIQKATAFFSDISNRNLPYLKEIEKDKKKAWFFNGKFDVKIETKEVVIYKDEKAAKFAIAETEE